MAEIRFRAATAADLPALAVVEAAGFEEAWSSDAISGYWGAPGARAWIAEAPDGEAIAAALFRVVADEAKLLRVATTPRWRRRQVGLRLLAAAFTELDRQGIDSYLEVRSDNLPAHELYRRLGFEFVGRRPKYYSDGCDAWLCARAARR